MQLVVDHGHTGCQGAQHGGQVDLLLLTEALDCLLEAAELIDHPAQATKY